MQFESDLKLRLRQQAAIADLGRQALREIDLDKLFEQATRLLAENLEVEYTKVLELSDDGKTLQLKAGVGWQGGLVGKATLQTGENSQAGYTLATNQPVVVEDLNTETRFKGPSLLIDHRVKSGISIIIEGQERPFGVLGAHTTQKRSFSRDDVNFVQAVANILATAIAFQQKQQALQASEERFRATFEQAAVGIAHVAPDGKWLRVNQKLCEIVGYTSEELRQKTFQDITYPEDLQSDLDSVRQILAGEIPTYSMEKRYIRRDGSLVWIKLTVSLVRSDGKPKYFISVVEDIDQRKHLETSLERSLQRLRQLHQIDQAILAAKDPEAIAATAMAYLQQILPSRRISAALFDWNHNIAKILLTMGKGREIAGKGYEVDLKIFQPVIEQFEAGKNYAIADLSIFSDIPQMQNLSSVGLNSFISLPFFFKSQIIGILKIWLDHPDWLSHEKLEIATEVSNQLAIALEQARLNQSLQAYATELETRVAERTTKLEEINEELKTFSYSISHDLKAPLRAIQGFAIALQEDYQANLDQLGREYTQRLVTSAQQMDRLIGDLLSYSRLSRAELSLSQVELSSIVTQAIEQLEFQINQAQAQIIVNEPLQPMLGNGRVLLQIVSNLLSNAIKFVDPDQSPQIKIRTESRGDRVRLWIEDNGIGIDSAHQERIFRVFERLHGSEAYPGTGIGLALVKKGMERLGGQVGVESEIGGGSRFWIEGFR